MFPAAAAAGMMTRQTVVRVLANTVAFPRHHQRLAYGAARLRAVDTQYIPDYRPGRKVTGLQCIYVIRKQTPRD